MEKSQTNAHLPHVQNDEYNAERGINYVSYEPASWSNMYEYRANVYEKQ